MTTITTNDRPSGARSGRDRLWPLWVRCLVAAAGMMAGALAPALLTVIPAARRAMGAGTDDPGALAWTAVAWIIPTVVALLLLLALARLQRVTLRSLVAPRGAADLVVGAVVALDVAGLVALTCAALHAVGLAPGQPPVASALPAALAIVLGLERAFLLQGVPEELWFRGFAWGRHGGWTTLAATTLTFTALHLVSSGGQQNLVDHLTYLVLPLGMGFAAGVIRWCFASTGGAIGVHGGTHTGLILPSLLGWGQGAPVWLTIGAVLLATGAVVLAVLQPWRRDRAQAA